jgi:uncharacterized protein (DUF58 family)
MPLLRRRTRPNNPRTETPVRRRPSLDFSVTGLIYTTMMLFMGLAAINSQASLLFAVFGLMIGVLLISGVISRLVLRKLEVRRHVPEFASVGTPATIQYEFINHKRFWPSLSVTVGELSVSEAFTKQPQAYLLHAAGKTHATVPMQVIPKRRGLHHFDRFQLSTSFPFGFIKRAITQQRSDAILIHPPLADVDPKLLSMAMSAEIAGARMRPRRGGTDEFYGVKEYRQGENPRWIHWRRSARTGTLVSKEMTHVAPPRLLILLDTCVSKRTPDEHAGVERAIAMAASLVNRAVDQGLAIGLYVWSGQWAIIQPSRGKRHARDLMSHLAQLPLNTDHSRRELLENGRPLLRTGTTAILITPRDIEQNLSDQVRSQTVIVNSTSEQSKRYFRFNPAIDFSLIMPADQQPKF